MYTAATCLKRGREASILRGNVSLLYKYCTEQLRGTEKGLHSEREPASAMRIVNRSCVIQKEERGFKSDKELASVIQIEYRNIYRKRL